MTDPANRADYSSARADLDTRGWCILPGLLPEQARALSRDLEPIFAAKPFCQGDFYGTRTKRFGSLLRRSPHAAAFAQQETILDLCQSVLGPWCDTFQLNLMQAIAIHPGAPRQFPHRDQDMWQGVKGEVEYLVHALPRRRFQPGRSSAESRASSRWATDARTGWPATSLRQVL